MLIYILKSCDIVALDSSYILNKLKGYVFSSARTFPSSENTGKVLEIAEICQLGVSPS